MNQKAILRKLVGFVKIIGSLISRYRLVIGMVLMGALFAYSFNAINRYSNVDRDESRVTDGLAAIKKVKFDNVAVDKIKALNDQNITVSPDLPNGRVNPFQ
jgi:hypothetical protein